MNDNEMDRHNPRSAKDVDRPVLMSSKQSIHYTKQYKTQTMRKFTNAWFILRHEDK